MPTRSQRDDSPGDARKPYSDIGGPAGKHAQTHDVRREALTNPTGPDRSGDEFADDIAPRLGAEDLGGHADESRPAVEDKQLHERLQGLDNAELARLPVLERGTPLEQGGVYVDLNDPTLTPFKALGGQEAERQHRYVAKRDTDYELWNKLVGRDDEAQVMRPETEEAARQ